MKTRGKGSSHTYHWQTLWLVVGPRMVTQETFLLQNIVFAPLTEDDFLRFKNEGVPAPNLSATTDAFVVRYPPRDLVQGRHRVQIDVLDSEMDAAVEKAGRIMDQLLVSLSICIPSARYHAEMRKVRRADEAQEYSAWSQTANVTPLLPPVPFEDGDLERTLQIYSTISRDETAENAYVHLLSAWQLQETAGSKPLQRSVLQHYVLAIEAVVNGLMKEVRRKQADSIRLAEREFAVQFAAEIGNRADKPEAIRTASSKLREISLVNFIPSVGAVAGPLGLNEEIQNQAKALYRFRSSSLSHPGRTTQEDYRLWLGSAARVDDLCAADKVARAFLTGYCALVNRTQRA